VLWRGGKVTRLWGIELACNKLGVLKKGNEACGEETTVSDFGCFCVLMSV
jgi:hypothetical protein